MAKKGLRLTLSSDTATFRHFWENEQKKDTLRKKLFNNKTAELERGKQQKKREASYFPNKKHFSDHNQLFIEKWPYFSDRYFSIEILASFKASLVYWACCVLFLRLHCTFRCSMTCDVCVHPRRCPGAKKSKNEQAKDNLGNVDSGNCIHELALIEKEDLMLTLHKWSPGRANLMHTQFAAEATNANRPEMTQKRQQLLQHLHLDCSHCTLSDSIQIVGCIISSFINKISIKGSV